MPFRNELKRELFSGVEDSFFFGVFFSATGYL